MSRVLLLVGTGGFIGGVFRYLATSYFTKVFPSSFPYGTFVVNIIGCLVIGIIYGLSERFNWLTPEWRLFLATGVCGGFTTFSAFAYENIKLLQNGEFFTFAIYSISSFTFGLFSVYFGLFIIRFSSPL